MLRMSLADIRHARVFHAGVLGRAAAEARRRGVAVAIVDVHDDGTPVLVDVSAAPAHADAVVVAPSDDDEALARMGRRLRRELLLPR